MTDLVANEEFTGELILKSVLEKFGLAINSAAQMVGISRSALSSICNHNRWPKQGREQLQEDLRSILKSKGASAATLADLFKPASKEDQSTDAEPKEDKNMLLRYQPLYQTTRKAFGLFVNPFEELNSADQVYDTADVAYIRAAMAQVMTSERFIAVVGESGAGKSTLRRDLIDRINREQRPVIVCEPYVLGLEDSELKGKNLKAPDIAASILRSLNQHIKLKVSAEGRFNQLHRELIESRRAGYRHVLIIEEAHCLSIPTLKHLKRFYELEDGFNRLLSIVLIGQTELSQKLAENKPEIREVVQRIEIATLEPLDRNLEGYLNHRLSIANKKLSDIMDAGALDALRTKLTTPARTRNAAPISQLYPLAVGNQLVAAMNMAAELGAPRVTADIINAV
jgi:type II secretory pathway predicted ATPase ExeA